MKDCVVLETCTGGGFSTISLAKYAQHVYTVEIDRRRISDTKINVQTAGLEKKVTFIDQDIYSHEVSQLIPAIDSAFLDPDWAVSGPEHQYRFKNSTTRPPSDKLLNMIFFKTPDVTLIQPPFIDAQEFKQLPAHECEDMFMNGRHELICLHFGKLANFIGRSEFRI